MGIKVVKDKNNLPKLLKVLEKLESKSINVGVLSKSGETILKIANAHEFGAFIKPNTGKYLTIPLSKKYKGVGARTVKDLFFIKSKNGNAFLARKKGKGNIELCYLLKESVEIPERPFIRGTFDNCISDIENLVSMQLRMLVDGITDIDSAFDAIGNHCVNLVRTYITNGISPANAPLTASNKGSSTPLIDIGSLLKAVDYEIV